MAHLLAVKPLSLLTEKAYEQGGKTLKRSLGAMHMLTLGIGANIGAAFSSLLVKRQPDTPGRPLHSARLSRITCTFAGLCYAEFASISPIAVLFTHMTMRPWASSSPGSSDGILCPSASSALWWFPLLYTLLSRWS